MYVPDETFLILDRGIVFQSLNLFKPKYFSFQTNWFCVSNQNMFHFESRIVSNYVFNHGWENSIVCWKFPKPIILEL